MVGWVCEAIGFMEKTSADLHDHDQQNLLLYDFLLEVYLCA